MLVAAAALGGALGLLGTQPTGALAAHMGATGHTATRVATAGPVFGRAVGLQLPLNAGSNFVAISSATCPQTGVCTLGGTYSDTSGVDQPMVVARSGGHWTRALELMLPSNAATFGSTVESVSCSRAGSCDAVGNYRTGGLFEAFTATESAGTWRQATEFVLPASSTASSNASINGVACTGPGSCLAVGQFVDNNGHLRPMAATQTHGIWAAARQIRLPAGAGAAGRAFLLSVACPKAGECAAVGTFEDQAGHIRAMAATESGGRWHQAIQLQMPSDAAAVPLISVPQMSVSCSAVGKCLAVSSYRNTSFRTVPMSIAESGGVWARARHVTRVPANAAALPDLTLTSVACLPTGICTASGGYKLNSSGFGALVMTRQGTRWVSATQITTPLDGATGAQQKAFAKAIGCTATGSCVIGGTYLTAALDTRIMAALG